MLLLVRLFYHSNRKETGTLRHAIYKQHPTKYCQLPGVQSSLKRGVRPQRPPLFLSCLCCALFGSNESLLSFPQAIFRARTSTSGESLGILLCEWMNTNRVCLIA